MQLFKYLRLLPLICIIPIIFSCQSEEVVRKESIVENIINDENSFFYIDTKNYPVKNKSLPIGIFDSGTGGLTVLDAIINFDRFDNNSHDFSPDGDSKRDFNNESFIYLGDKANMPYGEYSGNNKTELLKEHVIKDVQFLLGNKYYKTGIEENYIQDKQPVKAIVIACNTATAYGKEYVEDFLARAELDIKVIGVIGAGVRGALTDFASDEDGIIGVMATNGTCSSNGYPNEINMQMREMNFSGDINVFQQAGIGLAAAIDGEKDYINKDATEPRESYRGPSLNHEFASIDKTILQRYGFDWSSNNMLFEGDLGNPYNIQINSVDNYIAYHVVSFMEKITNSDNHKLLKSVILGCTHYPFYTDIFKQKFNDLYNFKENGKYVYKDFLSENISFIDPAINTAKELYEYLGEENIYNNGSLNDSEFYISVPNNISSNIVLGESGNFTYEYKYGRDAGYIQQYVKRVPFSKLTLTDDVTDRLSQKIPATFELIEKFNNENPKTKHLSEKEKILQTN